MSKQVRGALNHGYRLVGLELALLVKPQCLIGSESTISLFFFKEAPEIILKSLPKMTKVAKIQNSKISPLPWKKQVVGFLSYDQHQILFCSYT
jgi:hypothetical protein